MEDDKAERDARYCVVTLLYRGKIDEAQRALDGFAADGTICPEHAAFYTQLLSQARKHSGNPPQWTPKIPRSLRLPTKATLD